MRTWQKFVLAAAAALQACAPAGPGPRQHQKELTDIQVLEDRQPKAPVYRNRPRVSGLALAQRPGYNVTMVHRSASGTVLGTYLNHNLVTNAGMAGVASRINGAGAEAAFTWVAIGTGTNAAAAGDTTLQTEITTNGGARANGTASRVTTDQTNDTAQVQLTYSFTGSFAVTESGLLNASSAGVLLARQVFSAINVVNGDSLQITWKIDVD